MSLLVFRMTTPGALILSLLCLSAAGLFCLSEASAEDDYWAGPWFWHENVYDHEEMATRLTELEGRLTHMEGEASAQRAQQSTAETLSLTASMSQLQVMIDGTGDDNYFAFSAGLSATGYYEPSAPEYTVIYDKDFYGGSILRSEMGPNYNLYDPYTGVYDVLGTGGYNFSFSAAYIAVRPDPPEDNAEQCIQILNVDDSANTENVLFQVCGSSYSGQVQYFSHVFTASLRTNTYVIVRLPAGWKLSNKISSHNEFSGARKDFRKGSDDYDAFSVGLRNTGYDITFATSPLDHPGTKGGRVLYDRVLTGSSYYYSAGIYYVRIAGFYIFRFSAAYIAVSPTTTPTTTPTPHNTETNTEGSAEGSAEQCIQIMMREFMGRVTETSLFHVCRSSYSGQVEYISHIFTKFLRTNTEVFVRLPAGWKLSNENSSLNRFSGALLKSIKI